MFFYHSLLYKFLFLSTSSDNNCYQDCGIVVNHECSLFYTGCLVLLFLWILCLLTDCVCYNFHLVFAVNFFTQQLINTSHNLCALNTLLWVKLHNWVNSVVILMRRYTSHDTTTGIILCIFCILLGVRYHCDTGLHHLPQSTEGVLKDVWAILYMYQSDILIILQYSWGSIVPDWANCVVGCLTGE